VKNIVHALVSPLTPTLSPAQSCGGEGAGQGIAHALGQGLDHALGQGLRFTRSKNWLVISAALLVLGFFDDTRRVCAQEMRCDPGKVMGVESCAKCHGSEVATWRQTPHSQFFETLSRSPKAREITQKMGVLSVKRNELCINCHFTMQTGADGSHQAISGISCESCHGAARDWMQTHNEYGGPGATRESESPNHRIERLHQSTALGMRNTRNLYAIASSCLNCHTVPQEELVNVGGHTAGSENFELVAWSQGMLRHNFVRTGGLRNDPSTVERLRVMYLTGLLADLEYSTRATARATTNSVYGKTVAERAVKVALRLVEIQKQLNDPLIEKALEAFAHAELRTGNSRQLESIADSIAIAGISFASERDGTTLTPVDAWVPKPAEYKYQATVGQQ